uniref:Immunoglobulin superfamily member 10 n=1 Tax=Serinus canaria TaxID=9135 RepID=A0A8C9N2N1_SERCA
MKVTAVRHSKKHIDCRAEGTPPPQIMWIMPDNIFLTPLSLHCLAEGSPRPRLAWTLPGASAHDAGNYLCRAHNLAGDSSLTIPVVVAAYAPRIMGRPPPAIHTLPGAAVQLHCVVLGIPKPEITWELPDHSVLSTAHQGRGSGGELLHPTGTLLLQNPRPSSSGTYRCTARNPLARNTAGMVGNTGCSQAGLSPAMASITGSHKHLSENPSGRNRGESHQRSEFPWDVELCPAQAWAEGQCGN